MTGTIDLRVLSYNVHTQRDDVAALAAVVRGAEPDVVIVQEGPRRFRWRSRGAALARSFGQVVAAGGLPSLGNLLLTDLGVRVHETRCLQLPLVPGRHMRGAALAICSVGGARFAVAGSHLSTYADERPGQAAQVKKWLADVDAPVILGVDANEPPDGPAWRTLGEGLVDAAASTGLGHRATYPCAAPDRRIDAVFVDPRITVKRYKVIDTPQARRASDHLPVLAELAVPMP